MGILKKLFGKKTKQEAPKTSLTEQFIRCPQCSTLYALFAHIVLETIHDVRCGTCEHTFSALTHRSEPKNKITLPTEFESLKPRLLRVPIDVLPITDEINPQILTEESISETTKNTTSEEVLSQAQEIAKPSNSIFHEIEETTSILETPALCLAENSSTISDKPLSSMEILAIAPGDELATAPIYTRKAHIRPPRSFWNYLLASSAILLTALLICLLFYLNRETLGQYSATRPWIESMCQLFNCKLSPYRDPTKLMVQQHQISPDPNDPTRLELHALIENTGAFPQPLGNLVIQIKDLQGNPVKKLTFTPEEYAPKEAKSLLEPRQTLYISLEFIQPSVDLFGYEIKFI